MTGGLAPARLGAVRAGCAEVSLGDATLRLEILGEDLLRLRLGPDPATDYGILVERPAAVDAAPSEDAEAIRWAHGRLAASLERATGHLAIALDGCTVLESCTDAHFVRRHRFAPFSRLGAGWQVALALPSGAPIYGLGEQWGRLDRRGSTVVSRNEDALGVNTGRAYKNTPFAWSPGEPGASAWGLFVHTPADVRHAVGDPSLSHRTYLLGVDDPALDLFLFVGADGAAILERYTQLTGRAPEPPAWSYGVWLSRAYYETAEDLLAEARASHEHGIDAAVITLDGRAWLVRDTRFAFEWDAERYPDPAAFCREVHALGLRICAWEYPLVSTRSPRFAWLAERGWLLETDAGDPYVYRFDPEPFGDVLTPLPDSGLVDFTHPDAYAWYRDQHRALFEAGIDVMKSDFGEQVPDDAVAHNGDTGARLHNVYALLYNRCVYEATVAHFGAEDALVWARSSWAGGQRYPVHWGGDPQSDWEGLAASIRGGLSWGMSGGAYHSSDVGGFYGAQPDPELLVRWTQAGVFSSHLRFHGVGRREPWHFGDAALAVVRESLALRRRLVPYLRACAGEAARTGLPVMRAMPLALPGEPEAWGFEEQYLLGPDLLVAPVVRPGGRCRHYLPRGKWTRWPDGEQLAGGCVVEGTCDLDEIPVYLRAGARLP